MKNCHNKATFWATFGFDTEPDNGTMTLHNWDFRFQTSILQWQEENQKYNSVASSVNFQMHLLEHGINWQ